MAALRFASVALFLLTDSHYVWSKGFIRGPHQTSTTRVLHGLDEKDDSSNSSDDGSVVMDVSFVNLDASGCGIPMIPKFEGNWEKLPNYPVPGGVGEAQGTLLGKHLVVTGGFLPGFAKVTQETFAIDTTDPSAPWRKQDDNPIEGGVTHAAFAVNGLRMYMCGGYHGGHPGPALSDCLVFNLATSPGFGQQWTSLPNLPEPRGGGGLVFVADQNALVFSAGAIRPNLPDDHSEDKQDTWILALDNVETGWIQKSDIPYLGNHISFVTAKDWTGAARHYFLGGQSGENEKSGNVADSYEYDALDDHWTQRASLPMPLGHASSSTTPFGCGFLVAGGAINGDQRTTTDEISYYDIRSDSWLVIGVLPKARKTAVCAVSEDDYLWCATGYTRKVYRRKLLLVPGALPLVGSPSPVAAPTSAPATGPTATPGTQSPSFAPSLLPTIAPTPSPTSLSVPDATGKPSGVPILSPIIQPTSLPTLYPVESPTETAPPTALPPSRSPTKTPNAFLTLSPVVGDDFVDTATPSSAPSQSPSSTQATEKPAASPSQSPSAAPFKDEATAAPSQSPSTKPTSSPSSEPTASPSLSPVDSFPETTTTPAASPTTGDELTDEPTASPAESPTVTAAPSPERTKVPIVGSSPEPTSTEDGNTVETIPPTPFPTSFTSSGGFQRSMSWTTMIALSTVFLIAADCFY